MFIYWRETALVHRQVELCDWAFLTASNVCCGKEWGTVHKIIQLFVAEKSEGVNYGETLSGNKKTFLARLKFNEKGW